MSQSRARKPHCFGGETVSNGRSSTVKASGDSAPCPPQKSQPKQNSRSKNNIPKSIRYDLENALVGLCDVWFEDIKPHLVRNKIKLHVDTSGATASGDYGRLPPAAPGCSHLDPGAASDLLQQASANSAGCCLTRRIASKSRSHRPPAPCPPPPPRPPPSSPPTPPHWTSQNKNSKSKSPRRRRSHKKPQPPSPSTSNWQVPRLCRTYSLLSPKLSPRTRQRRVQTATPVTQKIEQSCLLALVPRRRTKTRNKYTQTEIPYKTKSYAERLNSMKRTNTEAIAYNNNKIPTIRHKHEINTGFVHSRNGQPAPRRSVENSVNNETYPLTRNPSPIQVLHRKYSKLHREVSETMDIDSVPSNTQTRFQSPQKQIKIASTAVKTVVSSAQRQRSRENRPSTNSAPQKLLTQEKRRADPSVAPPPRSIQEKRSNISHLLTRNPSPVGQPLGNQFWRCFATTNLNPLKNKKQECLKKGKQSEEPTMLFDKDLIDIIASRNDKRLKVLYKNTKQEDFPSVMNLVPSSGDSEKETSGGNQKTLPWR